jgi:hypothetical protein
MHFMISDLIPLLEKPTHLHLIHQIVASTLICICEDLTESIIAIHAVFKEWDVSDNCPNEAGLLSMVLLGK